LASLKNAPLKHFGGVDSVFKKSCKWELDDLEIEEIVGKEK